MQAVKGMRDFYPEEMRLREWLFQKFRDASLHSGFEFYDAPLVEHEELYIRKAGEEITEQLYTFEDKSERRLALRPEMTPSLARMVIARFRQLPARLKWATIAQCFRYERMTRGRKREHYQWNLDVLGDDSMYAEVDLLSAAIHALESMGITSREVRVRLSNRRLLSDVLNALGIPEAQHLIVFMQIDKLGKVEDQVLLEAMKKEGVDQAARIFEVIRLKDLEEVAGVLGESASQSKGLQETRELFSLMEAYGYKEYLEFDFSIVRGLAYYTGTVFEFFDAGRGLRAIAGGGRYDTLIENLANQELSEKAQGSISTPAVGFGFGDVVILELLKDLGKLPDLKAGLDLFLIPMGENEKKALLPLLRAARSQGLKADLADGTKLRKMLEKAEQVGASHAVILGSDELERKVVKLKDLRERKEAEVALDSFLAGLENGGNVPEV